MRFLLPLAVALAAIPGHSSVITYGDMDCLGQGCYGSNDPTAGATLQGLAPDAVTLASSYFVHTWPFDPSPGEFPGTDTIYVGSTQTAQFDGYSGYAGRVNGPQVFTLDYSSLIGPGQSLGTLTLGIAVDDFQFQLAGDPFIVTLNGAPDPALTTALESFGRSGPAVQFFSIGIDPAVDTGSHVLTLSIDEGGTGGDGWAVDFLTVGATTSPEPSAMALLALGLGGLAAAAARRRAK
jgi:hypothetical protein